MKRDAGWATALVVAAATTFGVSSLQTHGGGEAVRPSPPATPLAPRNVSSKAALDHGPCRELVKHFEDFFPEDNASASAPLRPAPASCALPGPETSPVPQIPRMLAPSDQTRFVIATLPDPLHTHLSLAFDRYAEAIQQAAADSGFAYDSSWMPWDTEDAPYALMDDQVRAEDLKEATEDQPGVLLFRKNLPADHPYQGLVVFVVGEEPTAGIHLAQFENAVRWIAALKRPDYSPPIVQILGPSFSGSLPSLAALLKEPEALGILHSSIQPAAPQPGQAGNANPPSAYPVTAQIYSGNVSSWLGAAWFRSQLENMPKPSNIEFASFELDDQAVLGRVLSYFEHSKFNACQLGIVSEDETAYGAALNPNVQGEVDKPLLQSARDRADLVKLCGEESAHNPVSLYYPRDISALRAAYQEQSVFSKTSAGNASDGSHHTLRPDLADPEGKDHDTIRSYGSSQTALSEEAVLLHIVSMLRIHQTQIILLRSSNPLDQLFLAHFFKLTYPEARVIVQGSDLLLRREVGANGLNGILSLSTYPSLPDIDDWTSSRDHAAHSHRAFTQEGAVGDYIALSALLQDRRWVPPDTSPFLPLDCPVDGVKPLPGYAEPFWVHASFPNISADCHRPLSWLTVLGNSGFLPIASLGDPSNVQEVQYRSTKKNPEWPPVPLSTDVALVGAFFWALFHVVCCLRPSLTVKPEHRSYFTRLRPGYLLAKDHLRRGGRLFLWGKRLSIALRNHAHIILIVAGSTLLAMFVTCLSAGYGFMSNYGQPLQHPRAYDSIAWLLWTFTGIGVLGNCRVEHSIHSRETAQPAQAIHPAPRSLHVPLAELWPVAVYIACTALFYWTYKLALDDSFTASSRIPTYIRSMSLTTGVSPVVPMLVLAVGMYGWCWYSLRGLALFGDDRPQLPRMDNLSITLPNGTPASLLTMLSDEAAAEKIEELCFPFDLRSLAVLFLTLIALCAGTAFIVHDVPLRSLGTIRYSLTVSLWIATSIGLLMANAWQLTQVWMRLRTLLIFLDKLPLRRTLRDMHGFNWQSIWSIGGNVLDIRYKLFYRQFETMNHLSASLKHLPCKSAVRAIADSSRISSWIDVLEDKRNARIAFAEWYAKHWDQWNVRDLATLRQVQKDTAEIAGMVLTSILIPCWTREELSLLAQPSHITPDEVFPTSPPPLEQAIRNAEELVCLLYLGFVQNILGRIRSFVIGMAILFLSIVLVLPSYPFDPRPLLTGAVVALFIVLGTVISTVYSQMYRDATLSYITNTRPGELGVEFWLKFVSFGIGPLLGLLATVFPQFGDFFFSWLQPSLSSLK